MSETKHTPEPWNTKTFPVIEKFRTTEFVPEYYDMDYLSCHVLPKSAFARAVTCVNACAGVHDPQELITGADIALRENHELKSQRDKYYTMLGDAIAAVRQYESMARNIAKELMQNRDEDVIEALSIAQEVKEKEKAQLKSQCDELMAAFEEIAKLQAINHVGKERGFFIARKKALEMLEKYSPNVEKGGEG